MTTGIQALDQVLKRLKTDCRTAKADVEEANTLPVMDGGRETRTLETQARMSALVGVKVHVEKYLRLLKHERRELAEANAKYTAVRDPAEPKDVNWDAWRVFSPEGAYVCTTLGKHQTDSLLKILNKE